MHELLQEERDKRVQSGLEDYPVYTARARGVCQDDVSEATLRLVHKAKKLAGAKVTTKVTN